MPRQGDAHTLVLQLALGIPIAIVRGHVSPPRTASAPAMFGKICWISSVSRGPEAPGASRGSALAQPVDGDFAPSSDATDDHFRNRSKNAIESQNDDTRTHSNK